MMGAPRDIRSRIAALGLPAKASAGIELSAFAAIVTVPWVLPVPPSIIPLFLLAWFALWLRGESWRALGLRKPDRWRSTVGVAALVTASAYLVFVSSVVPALVRFLGPSDQSGSLFFLRGNVFASMASLLISWLMAAIPEEMVYRGYLLGRLLDLLGHNAGASTVAIILSSALFALGHGRHSATFLVLAFLSGAIQAGAYLAWKGNLWMPILIHGIGNSISIVLAFLGLL